MSFIELAKKRCSIRSFSKAMVSPNQLNSILEAGRIAPTTANSQSHRIIIIDQSEDLAKLREAAQIYGAPCALLICVDRNKTWKRSFDQFDSGDIDSAVVMTHMMLAATECEVATVWVGYFKPSLIKELFQLPSHWDPVHILACGIANVANKSEDRHQKERLPLSETVFEVGGWKQ